MTQQFWTGAAVATVVCGLGMGWQVASAQNPPGPAVCMRTLMLGAKPAASVEEFMNEQISVGRERFVSLPMGDGAGLMCSW